MKILSCSNRCVWLGLAFGLWLAAVMQAPAACTLTNVGLLPLPELGYGRYKGYSGGLYPGGVNQPPAVHFSAGINIAARRVQPRDRDGNVNTNTGRIVLLSVGMSNTTQEFASASNDGLDSTAPFKYRADRDPAKNPRLVIVDGAQGGQDAIDWTNRNARTWLTVSNRLATAGVTNPQVQVLWIKQSLQQITTYGAFPAHAQKLQNDLGVILRNAKAVFPNLEMAFISCRTRCYATNGVTNPEPYSWETGFATKWIIEQQINGAAELNYDTNRGPAVAPWLAWGPYLWVDGTAPRSDGLTWLCSDLVNDYTHPSSTGVRKVADQLLAFFKTHPAATPWFLRQTFTNVPPACAPTASATNGLWPLTVSFAANASDPDASIREVQWTFDDGTFATNINSVKTFATPGDYVVQVSATDNDGNVAQSALPIRVTTTLAQWKQAKFTPAELGNQSVSGNDADPDGDGVRNELEYLMGLEPAKADPVASRPRATVAGNYFYLSFERYHFASDRRLSAELSTDLVTWSGTNPALELHSIVNNGATETVTYRTRIPDGLGQGFLRLQVVLTEP